MTEKEFIKEIRSKILEAVKFENVSFTEMSEKILLDPYKDMYMNVYNKGALIGFLLDIKLNQLSGGTMDLRSVMFKLSEKYGPDQPFDDDKLIAEITAMTYPEIGKFFKKYVQGDDPMPYKEVFDLMGWDYAEKMTGKILSFGLLSFAYNSTTGDCIVITESEQVNAFGCKTGDIIKSIDGTTLTSDNFRKVLEKLSQPESKNTVRIAYTRGGMNRNTSSKPVEIEVYHLHNIKERLSRTDEEKQLKKQVLYGG